MFAAIVFFLGSVVCSHRECPTCAEVDRSPHPDLVAKAAAQAS